jgi:uncharacterized protein
MTALLVAAGSGRLPVVKLLHERGLSVRHADDYGRTLLMSAAHWGYVQIAQCLITHGVAVNAVDRIGCSALHTTARFGDAKPEMVSLLLANGATVDLRDKHGQTPLYYAAITGHVQCAKLLLAAGADASLAVHDGSCQCLQAAVHNGHNEVVKLLLEHTASKAKANINAHCFACEYFGTCTAVMLAQEPAMLKLLLEAGADVHAVNSMRSTPLHVAAAHDYTAPVICLLIKAGVSVRAKNEFGYTAAQIAKIKGTT